MNLWFRFLMVYHNFSTTYLRNWWMVLPIANSNTTQQIWLGARDRLGLHSLV